MVDSGRLGLPMNGKALYLNKGNRHWAVNNNRAFYLCDLLLFKRLEMKHKVRFSLLSVLSESK